MIKKKKQPKTKTNKQKTTSGPNLWNSFCLDLKQADNITTFRTKLEKKLSSLDLNVMGKPKPCRVFLTI